MTIVLFVIGIILKNELFETFSSSLLFEGQKSLTLKKKKSRFGNNRKCQRVKHNPYC